MRTATRRKLAAAHDVQQFQATHPIDIPAIASATRRLLLHLADVVQLAADQQREQGRARDALHLRSVHEQEMRLILAQLMRLCRFVAATERVGELCWRASRQLRVQSVLLREVAGAVERAGQHEELLRRYGMPYSLIHELARRSEEYAAAEEERMAGMAASLALGSEIEAAVAAAYAIVQHLDALNRIRFAAHPEELAEWDASRSVTWRGAAGQGVVEEAQEAALIPQLSVR